MRDWGKVSYACRRQHGTGKLTLVGKTSTALSGILAPRPGLRSYHENQVGWQVGGRYYDVKLAALRASSENHPVSFHLFDETFDRLDWTVEPRESWNSLLRRRAEQLRSAYDYVRLWYSGGSDSHTMLLAFLDNDIHVDEIAMYRCSPIDDFSGPGSSETNEVALPFVESIRERIPKTKITLLDIGREQYERVYLTDEWLEFANVMRFRPYSRKYDYLFFPELLRPAEEGRSHCDVAGWEKPRMEMRDGQFYASFWDRQISGDIGSPFTEFFYVTPRFPELQLKQCHLLKNWVKENCRSFKESRGLRMTQTELEGYRRACRSPLWKNVSLFKGKDDLLTAKALATLEEGRRAGERTCFSYMNALRKLRNEHPEWFNPAGDYWLIKSKEYCLGA